MKTILGWIRPGFSQRFYMGGGDDPSDAIIERQKKEEERKRVLRERINQMYGLDRDPDAGKNSNPFNLPFYEAFLGHLPNVPPTLEQYPVLDPDGIAIPGQYDQAAFEAGLAAYNASHGPDLVAKAARDSMAAQDKEIGDANRAFYTEDLKHTYDTAKRHNTFTLADRGLLGGSAQIDTEAELNRDNVLGATRLEDEVRSAVAGLKNMREGERLSAIQLVNSGSGEDAVASAQAGLSRAFENASANRKANIASDLFANGAYSVAAGNQGAMSPLAYQQYQNAVKTFFNNSGSGGSGRVTST